MYNVLKIRHGILENGDPDYSFVIYDVETNKRIASYLHQEELFRSIGGAKILKVNEIDASKCF